MDRFADKDTLRDTMKAEANLEVQEKFILAVLLVINLKMNILPRKKFTRKPVPTKCIGSMGMYITEDHIIL